MSKPLMSNPQADLAPSKSGPRLTLCNIRRLALIAAVACHACSEPTHVVAQELATSVVVPESECKVKYVYLYSFALLTKWPESSFENNPNSFVIGVLGDKPFGRILDTIAAKKKIKGRRIIIRRFKNMSAYKPCHILYITASVNEKGASKAAAQLQRHPVMIVGETQNFEFTGGVIVFHIEDGNVRFSLNIDAARRRNLMISARLSRLARTVQDQVGSGKIEASRN